jgi:hypothetical protein
VRLDENYIPVGANEYGTRRVFAFGSFPGATSDQEHSVTTADPIQTLGLRIIMGKLLLGNYLQQIQCNVPVRIDPTTGMPGVWDDVPVGATPDDIAVCATRDPQVLVEVCQGSNASCLCQLPGGCNEQGTTVPEGTAVGIYNPNLDGTAQSERFMPAALVLECTPNAGGAPVTVLPDLNASYWNPSGFQQAPASCPSPPCYEELGPAIVWVSQTVPPAPASGGTPPPGAGAIVPTNTTCQLQFAADVVDKENTQVCAAPMGRPSSCDDVNLDQCKADQACTPGDVSAFQFGVTPLSVSLENIPDGTTGVDRTADVFAPATSVINPQSITTIQITEMGATGPVPYTQYTLTLSDAKTVRIHWTNATGLDPTAMYTITFPTTFADYYNQGLPQPVVVNFTTSM